LLTKIDISSTPLSVPRPMWVLGSGVVDSGQDGYSHFLSF
jgi:hypothetical protein